MVELSKTYDPSEIETKWYAFWEEKGYFKANPASNKPPFAIVMPPPNITGILHMGHVLGNTLQDILIRFKRMQGFETLWVPGTDHAGIATQTVVEKHLKKTYDRGRKDYTREEFVKHIWDWKEKHENTIIDQIKALGCSCDWSRMRFTMDKKSNLAVRSIFKKLYDEGLIYRGDYLVNWDPLTQTALADDEVEYEDREGHLWYISYPLSDGSDNLVIATTRPETMLGDTAVAVSARDERYKKYIGKTITLPITNREIPIISDHHVDPEFGTGVVKITPAHDPNDYEMGIRHNLSFINIMTPDGKINENGKDFLNLSMAEARVQVIEKLKELGLLVKEEKHTHRVAISYRSKATIEPYMSKQWFVKMTAFAKRLKHAVKENQLEILPSNWESTYFHWIDNLRDWCISRQLWWGHRIPIWYDKTNPDNIVCYAEEGLPKEVQEDSERWIQDEDVLDTWFSSALWPFSTLGWPEKTQDLEKFYPNSLLLTGHDILFFWVTRMALMGEYVFNKLPFPKTLLTGLIFGKSYWRQTQTGGVAYVSQEERMEYDLGKPVPKDVHSKWEKISKSKGNAIDPREIVDLYGTDAMRMALAASPLLSHQIDLDRRKFEEFKNFSNKLWNGARFVFMNISSLSYELFSKGLDFKKLKLEDKWILERLKTNIACINESLSTYQFEKAALSAYNFYWKELCAYYLEISKPFLFGKEGEEEDKETKQKVLVIVLIASLRLLHPMAPFITEEIFQRVKEHFGNIKGVDKDLDPFTKDALEALLCDSIMISKYPENNFGKPNLSVIDDFKILEEVIYTIRNIRGEMKIPPGDKTDLYIIGEKSSSLIEKIEKNNHMIRSLLPVNTIYFEDKEPSLVFFSEKNIDKTKIIVPMPKELLGKEKNRIEKELLKVENNLVKIQAKLKNPNFIERAPQDLVDKQKKLFDAIKSQQKDLLEKLQKLS